MIESIMEHISRVTNVDPVKVRLENLNPQDENTVKSMVDEIMKTSNFENRRKAIDIFNRVNNKRQNSLFR